MEIRIIHFYPDLMSLYGSYANVTVLRRRLELLGHTVCVEAVQPGEDVSLTDAAFLFMGAGTERAQKAALEDPDAMPLPSRTLQPPGPHALLRYRHGAAGRVHHRRCRKDLSRHRPGPLHLRPGQQAHHRRRLWSHGPLSRACGGLHEQMQRHLRCGHTAAHRIGHGLGQRRTQTGEGFHQGNVFASQLTGPLLVKDPRMLDAVTAAVYSHLGLSLPGELPRDPWAEAGFQITEEQLRLRCGK